MLKALPAVAGYKLERVLGAPKTLPISVTLSVTNKCNSRCRTCLIWTFYQEKQSQPYMELATEEYDRIFRSLGRQVVWATLSGGEPYLREDLPEICTGLYTHCSPNIINIATNGLLGDVIQKSTTRILQNCKSALIIVNLSLDGIGEEHDTIRGVPGNFRQVMETYRLLKNLKAGFPNLRVGLHTVVSQFNIHSIPKVYEYVRGLAPDSYITEIAENRAELLNTNEKISPTPEDYSTIVEYLLDNMREDSRSLNDNTSKMIQALRMVYYKAAAEELLQKREVIPCYAGYASGQIAANGDVWPCCVLGDTRTMGNLRTYGYDFKALWLSKQAEEARRWIKDNHCHCQLANAYYTNILCNFSMVLEVLWQYLSNAL